MNTIRVSNGLDPDQDRHCVGPDVCPNCLQSYQQTTKVPLARKELVRVYCIFSFSVSTHQRIKFSITPIKVLYQE